MAIIPYRLIRSARKTVSLEITGDESVLVRAPLRMKTEDIELFVSKHIKWIEKNMIKRRQINARLKETEQEDEAELRKRAAEYLTARTAYFSALMGLHPRTVKITSAKKRFGSCSAKNGICYSWRLMAYPKEAVDYVIVHELAHIAHKNHKRAFYTLIEKYLPDYRERKELLKQRG